MNTLIVFARAPRVGQVKTRLAAEVGAEAACDIYKSLLRDLVRNLGTVSPAKVSYAPENGESELRPFFPAHWKFEAQGEGDLGHRLTAAFEKAFADGKKAVVIIGSDCPEATTGDIKEAWKELERFDLVLGPAADGGYWLIGLRKPVPGLFQNIAWSTDQVLGQTLKNAKSSGLKIQLLRILHDVDTEADWKRYVAGKG